MGSAGRLLTGDEYRRLWVGVLGGECGLDRPTRRVDPLVVTASQRRGWRGLALVALLGEMGLRIGEAVSVRWDVFGPVARGSPVVTLPSEICKGKRSRQVIVTPAAAWALGMWRGLMGGPEREGLGERWFVVGFGRLSVGVRGGQKIVERFGRRYLGRRVGCHDLRRTFGDRVRRAADVRIAQLMLGHARLSSTERYLSGSLAERVTAAARIDGDLWPDGFIAGAAGFGPWLVHSPTRPVQAEAGSAGRS